MLMQEIIDSLLSGEDIENEDQYVAWVREWKKINVKMVLYIQSFRDHIDLASVEIRVTKDVLSVGDNLFRFSEKRRAKNDQERAFRTMSTSQSLKAMYSGLAREMYEARGRNKEALREGRIEKTFRRVPETV